MKIIVTGANSFIGRRFVSKCAGFGDECVAVVRRGKQCEAQLLFEPNVQIVECNMEEYSQLGSIIGTSDCLVSFAWNGTRGKERMNHQRQMDNFNFCFNGIKSMIDAGCKMIVTAGSQAEYGNCDGEISEDTDTCPNTEYGKYKLMLYRTTVEYCKLLGIKVLEPRFFSLYGVGDFDNTLISGTVRRMLKNEECNLTECQQMWDFLYIDDAVDALCRLVHAEKQGVYNFASGDCRVLRSFVEEMKCVLRSNSVINYGKIQYPETGMVSLQPCINKIQTMISWEPNVSFAQGIEMVASDIKGNNQ